MNARSCILAVYSFVCSIFRRLCIVRDVLLKKSKIDPKMGAIQLAANHWGYVEGLLLRHGVPDDEVWRIGEAYRCGFLRGWELARWYCRLFGMDCASAADLEWFRWASARDGYPRECRDHFCEAFAHGWKHRCEVA